MTTWTAQTEPDGDWIAENIFGFLLQETGEFLLQQDSYKLELDYARNSRWAIQTASSGGFTVSVPGTGTWTEQTVS